MTVEGGNHCSASTPPNPPHLRYRQSPLPSSLVTFGSILPRAASDIELLCRNMASTMAPKRQDTRKLIENLSGSGKSIAVLTSGGDAQGKVSIIGRARTTVRLKTSGRGRVQNTFSFPSSLFVFLLLLLAVVSVCVCCFAVFCITYRRTYSPQEGESAPACPTMEVERHVKPKPLHPFTYCLESDTITRVGNDKKPLLGGKLRSFPRGFDDLSRSSSVVQHPIKLSERRLGYAIAHLPLTRLPSHPLAA